MVPVGTGSTATGAGGGAEADGAATWTGRVPAGMPCGGDPLAAVAETLRRLHTPRDPALPPLTSGLVGYLGYDIVRRIERLPDSNPDDLRIPELVLLVVGIGCLQVMLDRGKELDWFNSSEIIVLGVVAVIALSVLLVWELTDDHPIIDLSLFKSRNFTIGCLSISLAYMLYFGSIVLLPQLLQV